MRATVLSPGVSAPGTSCCAHQPSPTVTPPSPALSPSYPSPSPLSLLPVPTLCLPDSSRSKCGFHLGFGLGALNQIPLELIWDWVEGDVVRRAWYLAWFVPPSIIEGEGGICLPRELLIRYGDREDVRRNFSANYSTGMWTGSS